MIWFEKAVTCFMCIFTRVENMHLLSKQNHSENAELWIEVKRTRVGLTQTWLSFASAHRYILTFNGHHGAKFPVK